MLNLKWFVKVMGNQLTGIAPSQILPVEQYLTDVPQFHFIEKYILVLLFFFRHDATLAHYMLWPWYADWHWQLPYQCTHDRWHSKRTCSRSHELLNLGNDTRWRYSYNGRLTGNHNFCGPSNGINTNDLEWSWRSLLQFETFLTSMSQEI